MSLLFFVFAGGGGGSGGGGLVGRITPFLLRGEPERALVERSSSMTRRLRSSSPVSAVAVSSSAAKRSVSSALLSAMARPEKRSVPSPKSSFAAARSTVAPFIHSKAPRVLLVRIGVENHCWNTHRLPTSTTAVATPQMRTGMPTLPCSDRSFQSFLPLPLPSRSQVQNRTHFFCAYFW